MKYARPILITILSFAFTTAVLTLAFYLAGFSLTSNDPNSANSTNAAFLPANIPNVRAEVTPEATATLALPLTPTNTSTPTEIPPVPPPTLPAISSAAFQQGMMLRTDGDYVHAADSFRAAIAEKPDVSIAREAQFRLGESLWLARDLTNAEKELKVLIAAKDGDNLAMRAHYFLADIFQRQKAYGQALQQLRAYRAITKSLAGEIDAQIGDILLSSGDINGAIKQYNSALQDPTLTAEQHVSFVQKLADAYIKLKQPSVAAARLAEAFVKTPDGATASAVEYEWGLALYAANDQAGAYAHWRHAVATWPDEDGAYQSLIELVNANQTIDEFQRGLVDFYNKSYDAAIQAFSRFAKANPGNNGNALFWLGRSYQRADGATDRLAIQTFDSYLQSYPVGLHAADSLYYKAKSQDYLNDTTGAVATYNQLVARFPGDSNADDALWYAGHSLELDGRAEEARAEYEQLASKYPSSPWASTALFNVGLDYFLSNNMAKAQAQWEAVSKRYPNTTDADHALFWLGKLANQRGDTSTATQFLSQSAVPPRSYYSWRSLDILKPFSSPPSYKVSDYAMNSQPNQRQDFEKWLAGWTGGSPVSSELTPALRGDYNFRHGAELLDLDESGDAHKVFEKVLGRFQSDARSLYGLAQYLRENNLFDLSIEAAKQIQSLSGATDEQLPRYLRELIYPTYYADLVVPYAERNGFDPAVFFALMRQESMFNHLAKSYVGAAGLTQVMPDTGRGIAAQLGVRNFQLADLQKPYVSIRFGTFYFGQLIQSFGGNILYSLAGYNAGPSNARRWQRPDVDVAVEIIHLPESYNYVRTIYSQYNQYLEIYRGR